MKRGAFTKLQTKAMELLFQNPMTRSDLGFALFAATCESVGRGTGSAGTNKFHRMTGRVIRCLERKGVTVCYVPRKRASSLLVIYSRPDNTKRKP